MSGGCNSYIAVGSFGWIAQRGGLQKIAALDDLERRLEKRRKGSQTEMDFWWAGESGGGEVCVPVSQMRAAAWCLSKPTSQQQPGGLSITVASGRQGRERQGKARWEFRTVDIGACRLALWPGGLRLQRLRPAAGSRYCDGQTAKGDDGLGGRTKQRTTGSQWLRWAGSVVGIRQFFISPGTPTPATKAQRVQRLVVPGPGRCVQLLYCTSATARLEQAQCASRYFGRGRGARPKCCSVPAYSTSGSWRASPSGLVTCAVRARDLRVYPECWLCL